MLRSLKRRALAAARATGLLRAVRESPWRRRRLLILCYHGVSLADEHEWRPALFISPTDFEGRLRLLQRERYNVLPLDEAVVRLRDGTLPPRSVAITFDDGFHDFAVAAAPLLRRYGFASTVYLTTYYAEHDLPVFPLLCGYLLWKARSRGATDLSPLLGESAPPFDLAADAGRDAAVAALVSAADRRALGGPAKDDLARDLARTLGVDDRDARERRLFHLMQPAEVAAVARDGDVRFELHTHRHRAPNDAGEFAREIVDNRAAIERMTGRTPAHFCYPSGEYRPEFLGRLSAEGVRSATTCEAGIADARTDPLLLPRLLDGANLAEIEVDGWLTGARPLLRF
ncbi:MAG TPA: polysaccharide deacetylase family protein [Gemmatimonadaceae bacterium]|nr:polysaccharide deacetylase family protein [Gemmatimonadaceae bacterium]